MSAPFPVEDFDVRQHRDSARRLNAAITGLLLGFLLYIIAYLIVAIGDGRFERQPVKSGAIDVLAERGPDAFAVPGNRQ